MIKAIYDSENVSLRNARQVITKKNSELKYGKKYPVLDPENDTFIVLGLDERGNPIKISRFTGKFSATKDKTTGELTSGEGTSFYDKWNVETNQMRKKGEEVFHETLNRDGKVIMSNPEYKIPKTQNLDMNTEFYTDLSTSDLAKKGYELKQIDMIVKGRKVREYLEKTKSKDTSISMHEQTSTNEIDSVLEDLYNRGDDIYKMSMKEWVTKIPEYFAEGGRTGFHQGSLRHQKEHDYQAYEKEGNFMKYLMLSGDRAKMSSPEDWINRLFNLSTEEPAREDFETMMKERFMYGEHIPPNVFKQLYLDFKEMYKNLKGSKKRNEHATGGVSNLFRERQGYRDPGRVIQLVKGARWLIRMLKEMSDDMIFGHGKFAKMAEALKMKYFKQTEAAIKSLESGGPIPDEILTTLRQDARFKGLTVSKTGDKDFIEIQEVVLGKPTKGTGEIIEGAAEQIHNLKSALVPSFKLSREKLVAQFPNIPDGEINRIMKLSVDEQKKMLTKLMSGQKKMLKFKTQMDEMSGIDIDEEIGTGEKLLKGEVVDEKVELFAFMNELPKELQHKVGLLPVDEQLPLLRKFKEAFTAAQKGGVEGGLEVLQKDLLEQFIPKGKPHATGGLIDGYATGGVSNLFRQRYRGGKAVELVTKLPEFLKFVERLLIKASNEIRQGIGKWKGLNTAQKVAQHDNLTKLAVEFQKTKKFDVRINEYTGIDAEKAFIETQAKVKEKSIFSMTKEEKAARLKKYQDESGIKLSYGDKDKRLIPPGTTEESIDLAILKGNFERKYTGVIDDRLMKQVLADNNPQRISEVTATIEQSLIMGKKGMKPDDIVETLKESFTRKKQAEGGLIGYATGGVSNLFRSR